MIFLVFLPACTGRGRSHLGFKYRKKEQYGQDPPQTRLRKKQNGDTIIRCSLKIQVSPLETWCQPGRKDLETCCPQKPRSHAFFTVQYAPSFIALVSLLFCPPNRASRHYYLILSLGMHLGACGKEKRDRQIA